MATFSVDGTLTIPFNIIQNASGIHELLSSLLHEGDIETVSVTTRSGNTYVLNHYDYINIEYKDKNIEEI